MRSALTALALLSATVLSAQAPYTTDPRAALKAGLMDAGEAIRNLEMVSHRPRPQAFINPADPGDFGFINSDLAFSGNFVFQGNYHGFQVWDISDAANPPMHGYDVRIVGFAASEMSHTWKPW